MPTANGPWRVARYYAFDIFRGEDHPTVNTSGALAQPNAGGHPPGPHKAFLFPLIWLSGLAYLSYGLWSRCAVTNAALEGVALAHTVAAFAMLVFIILHIHNSLTTGHSSVKRAAADDRWLYELSPAEEYLEADEPRRIL